MCILLIVCWRVLLIVNGRMSEIGHTPDEGQWQDSTHGLLAIEMDQCDNKDSHHHHSLAAWQLTNSIILQPMLSDLLHKLSGPLVSLFL